MKKQESPGFSRGEQVNWFVMTSAPPEYPVMMTRCTEWSACSWRMRGTSFAVLLAPSFHHVMLLVSGVRTATGTRPRAAAAAVMPSGPPSMYSESGFSYS